MRITIGGCRDYNNYSVFEKFVSECISEIESENIIILSGHCSGVDAMAERYAMEKGYKLEIYPADWKKYGRAAGPKRNKEMVQDSNVVIAFWDGKSKGTKSLVEFAKKNDMLLYLKNI